MKTTLTIITMFFGIAALNAQVTFTSNFANTTVSSPVSTTIVCSGTCTNNDCCINMNCTQTMLSQNLPVGWTMTMTNPNGTFTGGIETFAIGAAATVNVSFEIMADATESTGTATVRFENPALASNFSEFVVTATSTPVGILNVSMEESLLSQNYPNPASDVTYVNYNMPETPDNAQLQVFNLNGQVVATYQITAQKGQVVINTGIAAGTYSYSLLNNGNVIATKKLQVK